MAGMGLMKRITPYRPNISLTQRLIRSLLSIAVFVLALIGAIQIIAAITGNETVQPFRSLATFRPGLMKTRYEVLTATIKDKDSAEKHWKALQPTLALLQAINPDISNWMIRLNTEKRIIWTRRATLFNWPVLASYDWRFNDFYLAPEFWRLPEGEKAAVIAHEYFHSRQSKLWMVGDTILEAVSGKLSEYGSRTEDEAHLYQWFAYRAMDMPPSDIVRGYFKQRNLYRFVLSRTYIPDNSKKKIEQVETCIGEFCLTNYDQTEQAFIQKFGPGYSK